MFDKQQLHDQLKQKAKDALFERQFQIAVEKELADKAKDCFYSEDKNFRDYEHGKDLAAPTYKAFSVEGDDEHQTLKWNSALKDSAYYFDQPSIQQERKMKNKLQSRYDSLFNDAWRPPLQSRKDLLTWTCEQRNAHLKETHEPISCAYSSLLKDFGPDYSSLK
jgi:hypothetical protein